MEGNYQLQGAMGSTPSGEDFSLVVRVFLPGSGKYFSPTLGRIGPLCLPMSASTSLRKDPNLNTPLLSVLASHLASKAFLQRIKKKKVIIFPIYPVFFLFVPIYKGKLNMAHEELKMTGSNFMSVLLAQKTLQKRCPNIGGF